MKKKYILIWFTLVSIFSTVQAQAMYNKTERASISFQPTILTPQINNQLQVNHNNSVGITISNTTVTPLANLFDVNLDNIAFKDAYNNTVGISDKTITTMGTPPVFESSTPIATSIIPSGFTLKIDMDKAGTVYYVVLADGATSPTAAEVKAGTGNGGASAVTSGNATVNTGDFTKDFSVIGLTASTAYDVYVVAQDDESTPNLQTSATLFNVTTLKPLANIVISEIMYNPPESNTDEYEYIELYNAGATAVNLTGYTLNINTNTTPTGQIFTTGSIATGDYFVIAVDKVKLDEAFGAGTADAQWSSGSLSNSGEVIELKDNFDRVVDYVHYDDGTPWPTGADGDGPSIELRDVTFDNNIGANWAVSTDLRDIRANSTYGYNRLITGTPGLPAVFDNIAPAFENSKPAIASITKTGFTLETDINEAGVIYYVVAANDATAPTAAEVKAGTGSGGASIIASGNTTLTSGDFTHNFSITSLTLDTAYDVYVVAEDDEGVPNLQENPTKIEVTTLTLSPTNNILYVNKAATGAGNGNSWANAVPELADALLWAHKNKANFTSTTLQIWVAGGTYKPMYRPEDGVSYGPDQGSDDTFLMVNNVQLYGGFAGTETTLSARDLSITANKTTLSGDFNGDDTISGSGSTLSIGNNTENAKHVILSLNDVGTARLDGFTVTGGRARDDGGSNFFGLSGLLVYDTHGGGMQINTSSPIVINCTFTKNDGYSGAGIYLKNSSSKVINCIFSNNYSRLGGSLSVNTNGGSFLVTIRNSLIAENYASFRGGALFTSGSTLNILNTTIINNVAASGGNGVYTSSSNITLNNSILFGDTFNIAGNNPVFKNSLAYGTLYDVSGSVTTTTTTDANLFNNPTNGGYTLKTGSIAINKGDNTLYTGAGGSLTTDKDIAGNKRVFQNTIDLGAYESQVAIITPDANNIVYVNKTATGDSSGGSWTNAVPELADALVWAHNNKADFTTTPLQIWVAKGTYKPKYTPEDGKNFAVGTDAKDNSFLMVKNVQLYGGFVGAESTLVERDLSLTANKTTLSGDFNDDDSVSGSASTLSIGNNTDNAYHIVISADDVGTARLDGFTITGANASGSGTILVNTKSFLRNYGGGMYLDASSPTIENSTFINNYSSDYGSGIFNDHSSSPKVTASIFKDNKVGSCGAAIYNYNSSKPVITSSFFTGNNAHEYGGAIYDSASSGSKIINSTIVGNSATAAGAGIYIHTSTASIYNSIVWNEIATYGTGSYTLKKTIVQGKLYDQSGTETTTGLTQEKIFKDPNNGDYSLSTSVLNPAINGGDNTFYTGTIASEKDAAGKTRLFDGVATTDVLDLGAYELQAEPTPEAPTGEATQSYAGSATVSSLVATGSTIKWYAAATGGVAIEGTTTLINEMVYYASQTVNGSESTARFAVTAKKVSESSQSFLSSANPTVANLVATPGSGATVKWYTTATGGTALENTVALTTATYYAELTITGTPNYTTNRVAVTVVVKAVPTITFNNLNKTYGDAAFDLAAASTSSATVTYNVVAGGTGEVTLSGKNITIVKAGTVRLKASVAENANFEAVEKEITLTITKKAITITADAKSKVYGETDPTLTYQITTGSLETGDTFTGSLTRVAGEDAGAYAISSTLANANYNITFVSKDLTITKATQTIIFGALTHTQDVFDLTATSSSGLAVSYTSSNTNVAIISGSTVTVLTGGITNITATQPGNNNYEAATAVVQVLTIIRLGVDEDILLSDSVQVYPNPAVNFIRVDLGTLNKAHIKIYSITGKQLLEVENYVSKEVLNINSLKSGMYLLKIESDKASTMKKFIKR